MKRITTQILCSAVVILSFFSTAQVLGTDTQKPLPPILTVEQAKEQIFSNPGAYYSMPETFKKGGMIHIRIEGKLAQRVKDSYHLYFLTSDVGLAAPAHFDLVDYTPTHQDVILVELKDQNQVKPGYSAEATVIIEGLVSANAIRAEEINQWFRSPEAIKEKTTSYLKEFYRQYGGSEFVHGVHVIDIRYKDEGRGEL